MEEAATADALSYNLLHKLLIQIDGVGAFSQDKNLHFCLEVFPNPFASNFKFSISNIGAELSFLYILIISTNDLGGGGGG